MSQSSQEQCICKGIGKMYFATQENRGIPPPIFDLEPWEQPQVISVKIGDKIHTVIRAICPLCWNGRRRVTAA